MIKLLALDLDGIRSESTGKVLDTEWLEHWPSTDVNQAMTFRKSLSNTRLVSLIFVLFALSVTSSGQPYEDGDEMTVTGQVVAYRLVNEPKQPHVFNPNGFAYMVDVLLVKVPSNDSESAGRQNYIVVWSPYRAESSQGFEDGRAVTLKLQRRKACDGFRSISVRSAGFPSFVDRKSLRLRRKLPCYLATRPLARSRPFVRTDSL